MLSSLSNGSKALVPVLFAANLSISHPHIVIPDSVLIVEPAIPLPVSAPTKVMPTLLERRLHLLRALVATLGVIQKPLAKLTQTTALLMLRMRVMLRPQEEMHQREASVSLTFIGTTSHLQRPIRILKFLTVFPLTVCTITIQRL